MTTSSDASHVPSQSALGPERLFRPDALWDHLKAHLDWPAAMVPESARLHRLWVGRDRRVSFELEIQIRGAKHGTPSLLQGYFGGPAKMRRRHAVTRVRDRWLLGVRVFANGLFVCAPDRDPELPAVRYLLSRTRLPELVDTLPHLARTLIGDCAPADVALRSRLITYRLGKRCVVRIRTHRVDGPPRDAVVKLNRYPMSPDRLRLLRKIARSVQSSSGGLVRVPDIIDHCPGLQLVAYQAAPDDAGALAADSRGLAAAALALACLNQAPLAENLPHHDPLAEFDTVARWLPVIRALYPAQCDMLARLVRRLSDRMVPPAGSARRLIHRDYYNAQLLGRGDAVWLVDFDTLCAGHAELDVATYVAHLVLDTLRTGGHTDEGLTHAAAFMASYTGAGGLLRADVLSFYLACAMSRLGAIFLARGWSPETIVPLWRSAEEFLDPNRSGHRRRAIATSG